MNWNGNKFKYSRVFVQLMEFRRVHWNMETPAILFLIRKEQCCANIPVRKQIKIEL